MTNKTYIRKTAKKVKGEGEEQFEVTILKISYTRTTIKINAKTKEEADKIALEIAPLVKFPKITFSEYEIPNS
jgi:hypothetical protein